jgi:hypothetical protein
MAIFMDEPLNVKEADYRPGIMRHKIIKMDILHGGNIQFMRRKMNFFILYGNLF